MYELYRRFCRDTFTHAIPDIDITAGDLEGCKATLGEEHPDTLASVENLSSLLEAMGRPEDAEPLREWLRRAEAAR